MRNIFLIILLIGSLGSAVQSQNILTLDDAKQSMIENNLRLKNSDLQTQAAKETRALAKTHYYPVVKFNAFMMHSVNPLLEFNLPGGDLPVYDGNPANLLTPTEFAYFPDIELSFLQKMGIGLVHATQPIYVGGKIRTGNELAELGVAARIQQEQLVESELLLTTEQQYWQIVSLVEKEKTIEKYEELLDRLSIQVNDAYQAGLIIRNDVYKLSLEQSELAINKSKLTNGKQLALMQFCNTIGIPFDPDLKLVGDLDDIENPSFYKLLENEGYLSNLTEVQLLEKSVEIQQLQTQLKEGDYLPQVAAGIGAFYYNGFEENTGKSNAVGFFTVQVPISDWWMGKHDIHELEIKEQMASNTLNESKRLLMLRKEKAWSDLQQAFDQMLIMEDRVVQAEENLKVNQSSFDSGIVTLSDLLVAKALQAKAMDELIEIKTTYKLAVATYLNNTGR